MKKYLSLLAVAVLTLALLVASCGGDTKTTTTTSDTPQPTQTTTQSTEPEPTTTVADNSDHTSYTLEQCADADCHPGYPGAGPKHTQDYDITCDQCHGIGKANLAVNMPAHGSFTDEMCMTCHGKTACPLSDGHPDANCTMCHTW